MPMKINRTPWNSLVGLAKSKIEENLTSESQKVSVLESLCREHYSKQAMNELINSTDHEILPLIESCLEWYTQKLIVEKMSITRLLDRIVIPTQLALLGGLVANFFMDWTTFVDLSHIGSESTIFITTLIGVTIYRYLMSYFVDSCTLDIDWIEKLEYRISQALVKFGSGENHV